MNQSMYELIKQYMSNKDFLIEYLFSSIFLIVFIFMVAKYFKNRRKTIFLIAFPVLLFINLCEDLIRKELTVFDNTIYTFLSGFISSNLTILMKVLSYIGSAQILIIITLLSFLIFKKHKYYKQYWKIIALNLSMTWILNAIFKIIFHRQRPDILILSQASGYSFPSGHSMVSISFYGLVIYLCYTNIKSNWIKYIAVILLCLLIIFIGVSRIYLGVHYASDVIAGFSSGFAWLIVYITLAKKYKFLGNKGQI